MNKEQRAALRKLAEEAKLGPWKIGAIESGMVAIDSFHDLQVTGFIDSEDAAFLLAADPSTILQLLDYIEALEKDATRLNWIYRQDFNDRQYDGSFDDFVSQRNARIAAAMQGKTE